MFSNQSIQWLQHISFSNPDHWKAVSNLISCETDLQGVLVAYLESRGIPVFHIPNGSHKSRQGGLIFKFMGLRAGVPDLFIPKRSVLEGSTFHFGLFVELKYKNNGTSPDQKQWITQLRQAGYCVLVERDLLTAILHIDQYLGLPHIVPASEYRNLKIESVYESIS